MKKYQAVLRRFAKAFLSGFFTGCILITVSNIHLWADLWSALNALALAGVVGGINGIILAGQKYFSWTPDDTYYAKIANELIKRTK